MMRTQLISFIQHDMLEAGAGLSRGSVQQVTSIMNVVAGQSVKFRPNQTASVASGGGSEA